MAVERIAPTDAVALIRTEAPNALAALNTFSKEAFKTRGGRLGSGMGSLLEAVWIYFTNRALHNKGGEAADCEIGWLPDHEPNDFACVLRDSPWTPATREGELFRIEAKSMNVSVEESKAHFTELRPSMGPHDQLLILTWKWIEVDAWRFCPQVIDYLICPARPVAGLRDALHIARGGSFVQGGSCDDKCTENPCPHTGEPLNAAGKRERKGGPDATRPSAKVAFANNFGGLVRMLKTDNADARKVLRDQRTANDFAHEYISFIHRNFPDEEVNQYTIAEWRKVGADVGLAVTGKNAKSIAEELRTTTPEYQQRLRDLLIEN
ncbi:MAG: hypothetical protein ACYDC6_12035 [Acidobacteriaceae bacterium]